ncbi:signal transduction histidine kinase [Janthinobacterium sp. CG_23.3]|uniref:sensor histidine kinase n=1 Tax=unclassified Janthinobacterium TaxID=2610881 RepID=UPI001E629FC0|nr:MULTISPECIES: HAMP domain-containing sensor histidine kinase [unclassified Janthinobacterium]MEC5159840.1 signal transduction histidine kinase [Janthinobacterium sp. CG_S6]
MTLNQDMSTPLAADIAAIAAIGAVPTILQLMSRITGLRFACVARVTSESWTACAVLDQIDFGMKAGDQLQLDTTLCNEVRIGGGAIAIDHASVDPHFSGHITPRLYGFESYVSLPLYRANGDYFGTLCALDPKPAKVADPHTLGTLTLLADLISQQLEGESRWGASEAALLDARATAELREQFIAVLGHDLRTPLGSIIGGTDILLRKPLDEQTRFTVERMRRSGYRIAALVDDVLDFARGRMGGGIPLNLKATDALAADFEHVVAELRGAFPLRAIDSLIDIQAIIFCDRVRLAQLLSNLLTNALVHGAPERPVTLTALAADDVLRVEISNGGAAIAPELIARLFQPYWRGAAENAPAGLGLGLYIAAEIARCHGGALAVSSNDALTTFRFTLPLKT